MKITQRPTLFEITAALAKSGHMDMARDLADKAGVTVDDLLASRMNRLIKPKYIREKIRSAYMHPKQAGLSEQEQKDMLVSFIASLREDPRYSELAEPSESDGTLLCVVLPGNHPIWSYKLLLDDFRSLGLDRVVNDSQTIGAYVRKPRADVQGKLVDPNNDSTSKAR